MDKKFNPSLIGGLKKKVNPHAFCQVFRVLWREYIDLTDFLFDFLGDKESAKKEV